MQDVIAIIVTYNGSKWVDKCFGSLMESKTPLKVLAIDNGSTDGTPEMIRKRFPEVEVIDTRENLGFGKANNIGLKRVLDEKADFALLLNQDAWIEPDTVRKLVDVAKENKDFGVVSPIHLNGKGDAIDRNFQEYLSNKQTPGFLSDLFLNRVKPFYQSEYINAAAWLVTFQCIKKIGGFDPLFRHYGEDDDYMRRIHKANMQMAVSPTAIIYHDRPQDGVMNPKFYDNVIYTRAILEIKASRPNKNYLWRRILSNYFVLFFVYRGENLNLKQNIQIDRRILKELGKVGDQDNYFWEN